MPSTDQVYEDSLDAVQAWVEARDYKGYDPGDGQTTWLKTFTFGHPFAKRVLQQLVWKSPVNIRPFVGIKPMDSTKGRGFMAWGYLLRHAATRDQDFLDKARACLDWLADHHVTRYPGISWGNHFDFTTRSGTIAKGEPTIVWSGLIGQAVLEAFEQTGDEKYLTLAEGICEWILGIPRKPTDSGTCLSYIGSGPSWIHNSNLLGAAVLARTWKHRKRDEYLDVAREAMRYSCARQLNDGAWFYGEDEKYHWIDNFHTGYNLDSLKRYLDASGEDEFRGHLDEGYRYFKETFFEDSGMPRYYHDRTYPVDIQCCAQAIDTFTFFRDEDPGALGLARRVADWTIGNMRDPSGYFYYRHLKAIRVRTPYFHWGQATMFKALSHLVLALDSEAGEKTAAA
jgi:rhamnogalacturonyl hydrolase YesR